MRPGILLLYRLSSAVYMHVALCDRVHMHIYDPRVSYCVLLDTYIAYESRVAYAYL